MTEQAINNTQPANTDTNITTESNNTPQITFDNFIQTIPEQYRETFTKNGVKDFDTLGKSYDGLLQLKGKKGLVKPAETAPEEEKTAYREALLKELGRPETPEYDFSLPEGVKEEYVSDDFVNGLADVAFKNGLSKSGFQELIDHIYTAYNKHMSEIDTYKAEIAKKLGEDKISDNSQSSNITKEDYAQRAQEKMKEAYSAKNRGDYATAEKLQNEYRELLQKSF